MSIFMYDDFLVLVQGTKVIERKFKEIFKGRVVDRVGFMENFLKMLKEEKIKSRFLGDNVNIVKNTYFLESDLFYLENMFIEMGFLKVDFVNIREFFYKSDVTYIEINNSYVIVNLDKGLFLDLDYFKNLSSIFEYLDENIKSDVYIFGCNKDISKIKVNERNVYYYENAKTYIRDCLLKVKKCDA